MTRKPCFPKYSRYMKSSFPYQSRGAASASLLKRRQRVLDPSPGLLDVRHTVRKREPDTGGLPKRIPHHRRNMRIVQQVHAEVAGVGDSRRAVGLAIIIRNIREDI